MWVPWKIQCQDPRRACSALQRNDKLGKLLDRLGAGEESWKYDSFIKKKLWINYCIRLNSCQLEARNRLERCFQRMLRSHLALTVSYRLPDAPWLFAWLLSQSQIYQDNQWGSSFLSCSLLCRKVNFVGRLVQERCWKPWRCCGRCLKILRHGLGCSGSFIISNFLL